VAASLIAAWQPRRALDTIMGAAIGFSIAAVSYPLFTLTWVADTALIAVAGVSGGAVGIALDIVSWMAAGVSVTHFISPVLGLRRRLWRLALALAVAAAGHVGITWGTLSAGEVMEGYGFEVMAATLVLLAAIVAATLARAYMSNRPEEETATTEGV
jgi:hypothetical protein